jgi:hypothetical protein
LNYYPLYLKRFLSVKEFPAIWISWPKKSSKIPTDITEDTIREIVLPLGLVDIHKPNWFLDFAMKSSLFKRGFR